MNGLDLCFQSTMEILSQSFQMLNRAISNISNSNQNENLITNEKYGNDILDSLHTVIEVIILINTHNK